MSHYYTYNVVLALITEGQWWESGAKDKHAKQSAPEKTVPKKTRREKFVGAANQPECEKKWI